MVSSSGYASEKGWSRGVKYYEVFLAKDEPAFSGCWKLHIRGLEGMVPLLLVSRVIARQSISAMAIILPLEIL